MPKATIPNPIKGHKPLRVARKFKLGGRKNATGALSMSTPELLNKLNGATGKTSQKIRAVLDQRGFDLKAHLDTVAAEESAAKVAERSAEAELEADTAPE